MLPSIVVTVITAVPSDLAVTVPDCSTAAIVESEDSHIMFWFEASEGKNWGTSFSDLPGSITVDGFNRILVTGMLLSITVTVH